MITAKTAHRLSMDSYERRERAESAAKLVKLDQLINASACAGSCLFVRVNYDDYNHDWLRSQLKSLGFRLSQRKARGKPRTLTISWGHVLSVGSEEV